MMNFSSISNKTVLGKALRKPLALVPGNARVRILQGPLRGKHWIVGAGTHGFWLGSYESDKVRRFSQLVGPSDVVFDVGAHVGYYTLLSADLVGPTGHVVAIEPLPRNLSYLHQHIKMNNLANVTVVAAAAADRVGEVTFRPEESSFTGHIDAGGANGVPVCVVSLSSLVSEGRLPPPNMIKIDVEGAEARVITGAYSLLEQHRPTIFLALHGLQASKDCRSMLTEAGYDLQHLDGTGVENCSEMLAVPKAPS